MAIKIVIVEDELIIADFIQDCLIDLGYSVAEVCINYDEAIVALHKHKPDIVLIDISLKGTKSGIDVANYIKQNFTIPFIFCTSHSDKTTIDDAKKTLPFAYLIKPFNKEDLYAVIETALTHFGSQQVQEKSEENPIVINDSFFIKHKNSFVKLKFQDILYVEANDNYVKFFTQQTNYLLKTTLKILDNLLPTYFIRVHRSYIVNLNHLSSFSAEEITILNASIPVGKSYYSLLMDKVQIIQG
jgi:DNA-binding LytR/AlgR family response regulator